MTQRPPVLSGILNFIKRKDNLFVTALAVGEWQNIVLKMLSNKLGSIYYDYASDRVTFGSQRTPLTKEVALKTWFGVRQTADDPKVFNN